MLEGLFQPTHLLLILVIALVFFGPKRLPELGKGLGTSIRDFRDALSGGKPDEKASAQLDAPRATVPAPVVPVQQPVQVMQAPVPVAPPTAAAPTTVAPVQTPAAAANPAPANPSDVNAA
jgi:sec-independent protein translocase protein TatA